jgi:hypothetical protein
MTKASGPQAKFINAILKHGGDRVHGRKVFGKYRSGRQAIKDNTIDSCKRKGWVIREEVDGSALWSVTNEGRTAVNASKGSSV